jgi:hypothetical protein
VTKQICTFHIANIHNKKKNKTGGWKGEREGGKKQCTNSKDKYIIYTDILQNPLENKSLLINFASMCSKR